MTQEQLRADPEFAQLILSILPAAVVITDIYGKVRDCNTRAHTVLGPEGATRHLVSLDDWHPRRGSLAQALQSVAGSSNWTPLALWRDKEQIELKGRGLLLENPGEIRVLLMETDAAPHRFAEHSEQVRRLNAQLLIQRQTEDRLRSALQIAKGLRRELVHRVKNNLAIVSALLRSKARVAEHPAATEALTGAAARIHAIAIVHDILDDLNESETVPAGALATALLDHLRISICPPSITLESEICDADLHVETALPLCLLVNELVTNAIKHAFSEQAAGEICVTLAEENGGYHLTVADNGSGMVKSSVRHGVGRQIVDALTLQLNGELEVLREGGTTWSIKLHPSK